MKVIDYFDKAYIINLPERQDRLTAMKRELEKAEMPIDSNKVNLFSAIKPTEAQPFKTIGQKGCFLSHYTILKEARDKNLQNVLIMEDDLKIAEDFYQKSDMIIEQLKQHDWAFVYFGHRLEQDNITESNIKIQLQPCQLPIVTAHFYGVNGEILDSLVKFLEVIQQRPPGHPDGGPMHVDGAFSRFRKRNPDLLTLVSVPNLGWQRSSRSDIANLKWFDKTPMLRQIVNIGRIMNNKLKS